MNKGDQIASRYIIQEKLGEGGYAQVYRVQDNQLNIDCALKIAKGETEKDKLRFEQEAMVLKQLLHDNIVPIYDVFNIDNMFCYTMEYIPGKSLEYFTRKSLKVSPKKIAQFIHDVALALNYAHEKNIVHRDIKPANILYNEKKKKAYITDFGLAKEGKSEKITATNQIVGTPYYLSPEQARGEEVDMRSDIYSLGATMYHLLTKVPPFEEDNRAVLLQKIADESQNPKKIRDYQSDLHTSLEAICLKALQKKKENRYSTMNEFAADIKCYLENKLPQAPLYRKNKFSLLKSSFLRYKDPLLIFFGSIVPLVTTTFFYFNMHDIKKKNIDIREKSNKLEERKHIVNQLKKGKKSNIDRNHALYAILKKKEYIEDIIQEKQKLSKTFNQEKKDILYKSINEKILTLYVFDEQIYEKPLLFSLYSQKGDLNPYWIQDVPKAFRDIFLEREKELHSLLTDHEFVSFDYNKFKEKTSADYDKYYDVKLFMSIGKYYRNIAEKEFELFFEKFNKEIYQALESENKVFYHDNKLYYSYIIDYLHHRNIVKAAMRSAAERKDFNLLSISPILHKIIIDIHEKSRMWIQDEKSGIQYTQLYLSLKRNLNEKSTYREHLEYIDLLYNLSRHPYSKALICMEDLMLKYPSSSIIYNAYMESDCFLASSESIGGIGRPGAIDKVKSNRLYKIFNKMIHYEKLNSLDIKHLISFYNILSLRVNKKNDEVEKFQFDHQKMLKFFQENKNRYSVDLGLALYASMVQSLYPLYSKEIINAINISVKKYGDIGDYARLLSLKSDYYSGVKDWKSAYEELQKIDQEQYNQLIHRKIDQKSADYLTNFYKNYIALAKKSNKKEFMVDVVNKGIKIFESDIDKSLINIENLKLLHYEFIEIAKKEKLTHVFHFLKKMSYWK